MFYQKSPISCRKSLVFCRKSPIRALKLIKKSPTFSHIFQPKQLYFVPKSPVFCPTYAARTHNHKLSMTLSLTHTLFILTPCKSPTASQKESYTALLILQPTEPRIPPKAYIQRDLRKRPTPMKLPARSYEECDGDLDLRENV